MLIVAPGLAPVFVEKTAVFIPTGLLEVNEALPEVREQFELESPLPTITTTNLLPDVLYPVGVVMPVIDPPVVVLVDQVIPELPPLEAIEMVPTPFVMVTLVPAVNVA